LREPRQQDPLHLNTRQLIGGEGCCQRLLLFACCLCACRRLALNCWCCSCCTSQAVASC